MAPTATVSYSDLLDDIHGRLQDGRGERERVCSAMEDLFLGLHLKKSNLSRDRWKDCIRACRQHPLRELIHEDPFTFRAYSKPRGYAGDAELLDYIYGREEHWPPPQTTARGQWIFDYTTTAPAAEGVRSRRGFVATLIDRLADDVHRPEILSVAAGHFREASLSSAVKRKRIGRLVALDSDERSLDEVRSCYEWYGVETVAASVRQLIAGKLQLGAFDLVYSTGLFDYVGSACGRRLLAIMFQMLRPGGRVLVANFLPGIRDSGFMEAFMDWLLIYRTRQEMVDITMEIPQDQIQSIALFAEENQNIIFAEVTKI